MNIALFWISVMLYIIFGIFIAALIINIREVGNTVNNKVNNIINEDGGCICTVLTVMFWPCTLLIIIGYVFLYLTKDLGSKIKKLLIEK